MTLIVLVHRALTNITQFSNVSIIAVSYEARAHGVTRNMWADDAKKLCPDLQVARVRESHGKADLTQ